MFILQSECVLSLVNKVKPSITYKQKQFFYFYFPPHTLLGIQREYSSTFFTKLSEHLLCLVTILFPLVNPFGFLLQQKLIIWSLTIRAVDPWI